MVALYKMLKNFVVLCLVLSSAMGNHGHNPLNARWPAAMDDSCKHTCANSNEVYLPELVGPNIGDLQCDSLDGGINLTFLAPAGCYCRPGYARDSVSVCIPTEDCHSTHCPGANEMYLCDNDVPNYDPLCHRLDYKVVYSPEESVQLDNGCYCIEGAARNEMGVCVPAVNCPKLHRRCPGSNEVYYWNQEAPPCDKYCPDEANIELVIDSILDSDMDDDDELSTAGCYCREGYFRNADHMCVDLRFCEAKCPNDNEIFLPPGTAPRCENQCERGSQCLPLLDMPQGCYCRKGFCRNNDGLCVIEHEATPCFDYDEKQ